MTRLESSEVVLSDSRPEWPDVALSEPRIASPQKGIGEGRPKQRIAHQGKGAVHRPVSGGMPAREAYAMASGTSSAHTVSAAISSRVNHERSYRGSHSTLGT